MAKRTKYYYGEEPCSATYTSTGKDCRNQAYYENSVKSLLCGVHSSKDDRTKLPKNPNREAIRQALYAQRERQAEEARKKEGRGDLQIRQLRMRAMPEYVEGFISIFPNFLHANRKDGIGCATLSPKSLGPVEHNMPLLPPAKNLENFHQFAKMWPFELEEPDQAMHVRIRAYGDTVPHRHKFKGKCPPSCSIYYQSDGTERRYKYIQSRFFYCKVYEKLALQQQEFVKLKTLLEQGYNLCIFGYDGFPIEESKDLLEYYEDPRRPFGHELVLYCLLHLRSADQYPWNRYRALHPELYKNYSSLFD